MTNKTRLVFLVISTCFVISAACSGRQNTHQYQSVILSSTVNSDSLPFTTLGLLPLRKDSLVVFSTNLLPGIDSVKRKRFNFQDSSLSADPKLRYLTSWKSFFVLYAYKGNKVYMVFDTDNNGSFEGEQVYDAGTYRQFIRLNNLPYNDGKSVKRMSFMVSPCINPFSTGGLNNKYSLGMLPVYKQGILKTGNGAYNFAVFNGLECGYNNRNTILTITPSGAPYPKFENAIQYKVGDTLYLGTNVFVFAGVNNNADTLTLESLQGQKLNYGVGVNDYAFNLTGKDLLTGKPFTTGKGGRYTLLDFWGTWCGPCKALTPRLKQLHEKIPDSEFNMVSIAWDENQDTVKSYLGKEEIQWVNLFDDKQRPIFAAKFKINACPTLMLLDEKGKILFRGVGEEALNTIEWLLAKKKLLQ